MKGNENRYCSSLLISPDSPPPCSFVLIPILGVRPSRSSARAAGYTRASERFGACTTPTRCAAVGRPGTKKDFRNPHTSRTRKRSEQAVQFFGTVKFARTPIPRYLAATPPPSFQSFVFPPSPLSLSLSLSIPVFLSSPLPRLDPLCTYVEYRATCDRYRARKFRGSMPRGRNSLPTFLLLLFVPPSPPPWSPAPRSPPPISLFPTPFFLLRHQFFSPISLSLSVTFSPISSSGRCRSGAGSIAASSFIRRSPPPPGILPPFVSLGPLFAR